MRFKVRIVSATLVLPSETHLITPTAKRRRRVTFEGPLQKIRAAIDARSDPDFMIIARCDALSVAGIDEVVRRALAYQQIGADTLFIESPRSIEEITAIPQRLPGVHLFNMSASGKTPLLWIEEVGLPGYKLMSLPNFTTLAAIKRLPGFWPRSSAAEWWPVSSIGAPACRSSPHWVDLLTCRRLSWGASIKVRNLVRARSTSTTTTRLTISQPAGPAPS